MKTNVDNLEAVAQLLEQLALEAERAGKPVQWAPWATVRNAAQELTQLRANYKTTSGWFDDATQQIATMREEVADLGMKLCHARDDIARLDWLNAHEASIEVAEPDPLTCRVQASDDYRGEGYSNPYDVRKAIDAARNAIAERDEVELAKLKS